MPSRQKKQKGICRLCKKQTDLTFEHIPPRSAFNKTTTYQLVDYTELLGSSATDKKIKGQKFQGGIGEYSLCLTCNNFLGNNYVNTYKIVAEASKEILEKYDNVAFSFKIPKLSPHKLIKQVISMFISMNTSSFTDSHPDLLRFVLNTKEKYLPEKYKVYMYLNDTGINRHIPIMYNSKYGFLSEITFSPLGFVLSFDELNPLLILYDITSFKNSNPEYEGEVLFELNVLPTHLFVAGDYRIKSDISSL